LGRPARQRAGAAPGADGGGAGRGRGAADLGRRRLRLRRLRRHDRGGPGAAGAGDLRLLGPERDRPRGGEGVLRRLAVGLGEGDEELYLAVVLGGGRAEARVGDLVVGEDDGNRAVDLDRAAGALGGDGGGHG